MEGHNLKTGDVLRQLPHVVHSMLPKCDDPVVQESYNRTGVVTPDQVHRELFRLMDSDPTSKF